MATKYFLGIDLDTDLLRAAVMDSSGQLLGEDFRGYPAAHGPGGALEQDPGRWTRAAAAAVPGACRRAGISPDEISAAAIAGQDGALVPVDAAGNPVRPAILSQDRRLAASCAQLAESIPAADIAAVTGLNLSPLHILPKILWLKSNEPENFEKTKMFATPGSFLLRHITGEWAADPASASSYMLMDAASSAWSEKMLAAAGIPAESLPPIAAPESVAGRTAGEFSRLTGIPEGIPVAVGTGRCQASAIGAGAIEKGIACDIISYIEPVLIPVDSPYRDESRLLETRASALPGSWFLQNPGFLSFGNFKWLADNFGKLEKIETEDTLKTAYDLLAEQAAKSPPGAGGIIFFPFMDGAMAPEWNPAARAMFTGVSLEHGRSHIIRAVLEGAVYALRDIVERSRECGFPVENIRLVGSGARGRLTEKIRADITGIPVSHTNIPETAPIGATIIAATAAGVFSSIREAASACIRVAHVHDPDPEATKIYNDSYSKYRLIYDRLKNDFNTLWG